MLNYLSYTPNLYKKSLVKTLINRTFKICSNWTKFNIDVNKIKIILQRNAFPLKFIELIIRNYVNETYNLSNKTEKVIKNNYYFKLPYIGDYSDKTSEKN